MSVEFLLVQGCLNDCGKDTSVQKANGRTICSKACMDELNDAYYQTYPKSASPAFDMSDVWTK